MVTSKATDVILTRDSHASGGPVIAAALKANVPVVLENLVDTCIAAGERVSEQPFLLAGEAREEKRFRDDDRPRKTVMVVVKGRGAVDVESGMVHCAHVLQKGDNVYSATLSRTDLAEGANSFYILQIIQRYSTKDCYLWKNWGRNRHHEQGQKY